MINSKTKREKGISLISLIITIIVLVVLTNVIIYNISDSLQAENLKAMQNDVETLKDKVSSYYVQNGKIPASLKYTDIQHIKDAGVISEAVDTGDFLVIDLSAIEDVTLNFGKDFENIKEDTENINNYKDLYIINEASHNIFYVDGVTTDGNTFYTNYTAEDIDSKAVDFRYVDGIKIPDEFYYVEGTKQEGIIIKSNDNTQEYEWIQYDSTIQDIPDDIELDNSSKEDFIKSVNAYHGYYKGRSNSKVIYLELENWTSVYDKEGIYKDKNGNSVYVPKGFQVSKVPGEDTVDKGIVIKNVETGNRYVWIDVPKSIYKTATSNNDYTNIESDMLTYVEQYTDNNFVDSWYNGCGITAEWEYNELKNKMLSSVYEKGGFWIGQYEAGIDTPKTSELETESIDSMISTNGLPLSQKNKYPYNFITCSQAQQLAHKLSEGKEYNTSLMFGIQWDLVCKFIETTNAKNKDEILRNSINWGNYKDATFEIAKGKYTENPHFESFWKSVNLTGTYLKPDTSVLLTTGTTNRNSTLNLYDLAGNVCEWTLEKSENDTPVNRGGHWESEENEYGVFVRNDEMQANRNTGFRIALY